MCRNTEPLTFFVVPAISPSYNRCFKINHGLKQTYLSTEARMFKDKVKLMMPSIKLPENVGDLKFSMLVEVYNNWYYKNGNMKKQDVQNMEKLIIDAVFEGIGIDDSHLWEVKLVKRQNKDKVKTVVTLWLL